ncbi:radical SAM protein [Candidatus Woesearchaeota archaeon]|nr:radical SAM protein [Candidatus Woesearchaeota archaeon]MCF7901203.1 radical SAM protein [Candidatus Woesearchaeota archaeon]MCF8013702.1 radical SAM protein [Candidatus Woesearchaeota archaeon]
MVARLEFNDLSFKEEKENIKVDFMKNYYFYLNKNELSDIGKFSIEQNAIIFECSEKKASNKFNMLLNIGFENLIHKVRNKKTIYIHKNSGIPLIGTNEFGLIDRGTNIIEVKPLTGCNLSCIFCSVNEGINDKKDIVVEEEYLVEEFAKLAKIKKHPIEANIGPQGEPMLYPKFLELVRDLKKIPNVKVISVNTNGLFLNPKTIDELAQAGLTRINLSLHALDKKLAKELANGPYNIDQILKMIKYCEGKIDVLLAPVLIPKYNEEEIGKIVELSKTIKNKKYPTIGIQNFLNYKSGRNIVKQWSWEKFYEFLEELEKKHDVSLKVDENVFNIHKEETLPKPFKKNNIIEVEIKSESRNKREFLAAAKERCITIVSCDKKQGKIKVRLLRDKHNIYTAIPV